MKKVLVVDDEPLILYSLAKTLQDDGMEVTTVDNGTDAIEASRRCFYNLSFLDLRLPDIHGVDVMMKIKELSPESKILAMSASCIDDKFKELIEKNAYLFIPKPFELKYVKAIAHQIVESGTAFPHSAGYATTYGKTPADEHRRIERTAHSKAIMYKVNCLDDVQILNENGHIVDISKAGMCIHTDYPVRPGSVIRFDAAEVGIAYNTGIVRNTSLINNNMYRLESNSYDPLTPWLHCLYFVSSINS